MRLIKEVRMNKRAKLAILGIAATFILVVGIFVVSTYLSSAQDWSEYLKLESNTNNCFIRCEAIFTITNPSVAAISLGSNDVRIWSEAAKGPGLIKPIEVYKEEDVSYEVEVPEYGKCSYTDGNGTLIEYECQTSSHKDTRTEKQFVPFDFADKTLSRGEKWRIKIVGYKKPVIGENNVEWLIDFKGMQPPWAWWSSNYKYRRNNTVNTTIPSNVTRIAVPINGSEGFGDGVNREIVWCLLDGLPGSNISTNITFYYNNLTDYRCVNASGNAELPIETERGNGTTWNLSTSKALWQATFSDFVFHFNNSIINSTGGIPIFNPFSYNNSGLIGTSIRLDNLSGSISLGNVPETPKFSMEIWLKLNAIPGSTVFFVDDWYAGQGQSFSLGINTNGDLMGRCGDGSSGDNFPSNFTFDLNKWHQVVITGAGTQENVKAYVDGRLVAEPTADLCHIVATPVSLIIGGSFDYGEIDEVRIYNTTLNQNEIKARYEILANNWSTLGPREMRDGAPADELGGDDAILQGIKNSTICNQSQSSCTDAYVHSNQQVYTVNGSGDANQKQGRFDYVFVNLNQTWAFNYISANENTSGFTNMVDMIPVFYVWEAEELNYSQIREQVTNLIDSTNSTI